MERRSRLGFLVAICIVVYFQCVCTSAAAITATACTTDANCTAHNAMCHNKTHCVCKDAFKDNGAACVPKVLGASCSKSNTTAVCGSSNTISCVSGHCACLNNSYVEENDACKAAVGKTCATDGNCLSSASCNKTCICRKGHIAEHGRCSLAVGTACTKATDCVTNANCDKTTNKCICSTGYVVSNGKCSQQSSADSVKMTINAIIVSLLCAALWNFL